MVCVFRRSRAPLLRRVRDEVDPTLSRDFFHLTLSMLNVAWSTFSSQSGAATERGSRLIA